MRSQKVFHLFIILLLLCIPVSRGRAASPGSVSQGEHRDAMREISEGTSLSMSRGDDGTPGTQATVSLSSQQRQLVGVTTAVVERTPLTKTIRAVARVDFDERRLTDVTFKVSGWVQDLF